MDKDLTLSLGSVSPSRGIFLSNDKVKYVEWPYDLKDTDNLWLLFSAKVGFIKFVGAAGDSYGITTGDINT